MSHWVVVALVATSMLGCRRKAETPPTETTSSTAAEEASEAKKAAENAEKVPEIVASRYASKGKVVAIGDVHGDFSAMKSALLLGGVIDESGAWAGGDLTFVQTGDLLDRGDDEQQIVDFLETLEQQAKAAGGQVVSLNGNHEVMNVAGDLRYVTPGGFKDFEDVKGLDLTLPVLERLPEHARARAAAFLPGGPYAKILARKKVIAVVDDTVYVHGGVLEHHATYGIDAINQQTSDWMLAKRDAPAILQGEDSPIWARIFSQGSADCAALQKALDAVGAKRMVVGHTVQPTGITSACDDKVWRIDVGMAAHYGGKPAALQIIDGVVKPL